jgi:hypothetical protein
MTISRNELIDEFGSASDLGNAVLFIGAGISCGAGLPNWDELIDEPRKECQIPELQDAPMVAEYIENDESYGKRRLERHVLDKIAGVPAGSIECNENHELISRLDVQEIWTTNYDRLLEQACPDAAVVFNDDNLHEAGTKEKTIIKMHGSISANCEQWDSSPVLTRTDYEMYESTNPRLWSFLRGTYVSKVMLFLGFSFRDPNVGMLLRLARQMGTAGSDRHLAIMKKPDEEGEAKEYELHVKDLEKSGIRVCTITDYHELTGILSDLSVRTRKNHVFISGSYQDTDDAESQQSFQDICEQIGSEIADIQNINVVSLGGQTGWYVSKQVFTRQKANNRYDPSQILIYTRQKKEPSRQLEDRIGTLVNSQLEREDLVNHILSDCRAFLVITGHDRTKQEIEWAKEHRVGIIPVASEGGAAKDYWEEVKDNLPLLGGKPIDPADWKQLANTNKGVVSHAVSKLLRQATFEGTR